MGDNIGWVTKLSTKVANIFKSEEGQALNELQERRKDWKELIII